MSIAKPIDVRKAIVSDERPSIPSSSTPPLHHSYLETPSRRGRPKKPRTSELKVGAHCRHVVLAICGEHHGKYMLPICGKDGFFTVFQLLSFGEEDERLGEVLTEVEIAHCTETPESLLKNSRLSQKRWSAEVKRKREELKRPRQSRPQVGDVLYRGIRIHPLSSGAAPQGDHDCAPVTIQWRNVRL